MQRIAFATLATILAFETASAAPLNLRPQAPQGASSQSAVGSTFAAAPTPTRYAAAETSYGGGFIEMLFRGPGRPPQHHYPPQRHYEPLPAPVTHHPAHRRPFVADPDRDDYGPVTPQTSRRTMDPRFERQEVSYSGSESPGTIIINTRERYLYLVEGNGRALRYGIGVGRPGFTWAGRHTITAMREWPDWRPPPEMLRRQPHLPRYMRGGPDNPLGARAMYLGSTLYRIHGSNEPWTIGQAVSSGCIRMRNEDVIDLYGRVRVGTRVVVI